MNTQHLEPICKPPPPPLPQAGEGTDRAFTPRGSFTLLELLVVVTIISILIGLVYAAMSAAQNATQVNRTRATVAKLHHLIMAKYDSFRTRRVPIDLSAASSPANAALARLFGIREMMRMEMPDRLQDIDPGQVPSLAWPSGIVTTNLYQNALCQTYRSYQSQKPPQSPLFDPAEALYMLITVGCPNSRQQFTEDEIGDQDGDGWPEFLDAWGNPIMFIRWAAAFTDSAIQLTPGMPDPATGGVMTAAKAAQLQHDPFDPRNVDPSGAAYQLIPLIYSAGPDGIYGIDVFAQTYYQTGNVYSSTLGAPVTNTPNTSHTNISAGDSAYHHYDNIHNHRMGLK